MSIVTQDIGKPLSGIEIFESRGSTVHTHYDGREIQRIFYLRPASMAPAVIAAMQGSVVSGQGIEGATVHRLFPARDPYYDECYCSEVKMTYVDPRANSSSDSLELNHPVLFTPDPEFRHGIFMQKLNDIKDTPAGGCFLTASYRPLITGWEPGQSLANEFVSNIDQRFDWVNPHFTPTVRTVPWPDGFRIATGEGLIKSWTATVPDEVAEPVNIPVIEFTVKRLFVATPEFDLLNALLNTVNKEAWPNQAGASASMGTYKESIPQFPAGTLRFDNYEIIEHASPVPAGPVWYEIVYHFSWLSLKAKPVFDDQGELSGDNGLADVTWNHVLMRPLIPTVETTDAGKIKVDRALGWYYVVKVKRPEWLIDFALSISVGLLTGRLLQIRLTVGPLYTLADFDPLFKLNP